MRVVMPGLVPGIHVLFAGCTQRRGWPGQARPWHEVALFPLFAHPGRGASRL